MTIEARQGNGNKVIGSVPCTVRIRKNANTLTNGERDRFIAAFAQLNNRMMPFYLVTAGAVLVVISKAFAGPDAAGFIGVALTLVGSVWSTLNRSLLRV